MSKRDGQNLWAIRRSFGNLISANLAAAASFVFHQEGQLPLLRNSLRNDAGNHVSHPTCREMHHVLQVHAGTRKV